MDKEIKEALQKQMQLLLERSMQAEITAEELGWLTHAMVEIARTIPKECGTN